MKLSIIIPVYNTAPFLAECLQSILAQDVQDVEVICINDGSTDHSLQILKKFSEKDTRIKIIDQHNQGVSAARNAGLAMAKGEYVGFVDADDTIANDYFSLFLNYENIDVISTVLNSKLPSGIEYNHRYSKTEIQQHIFPIMLAGDHLNSACSKMFRNEIIQNQQLKFPLGMKLGEDAHFIMKYLSNANSFMLIKNNGYHYRENPESASRSVKNDDFFKRVFQEFEFDHQQQFSLTIPKVQIEQLKAKRLVHSFVANLSLFLRNNEYLSKSQRDAIVKENMKRLAYTGVLKKYGSELTEGKGKFEQMVINALTQQSFTKIKWAYKYSHWRNKIK